MSQMIKVFTPVKRVPTMIGKAQNGQKLPFGPYTLLQVGGAVAMMLLSSVCALTLPVNPAVAFVIGLALTVVVVFALGLVPYTGVRITSRAWWLGRLVLVRTPVSASGMPITGDSVRHTLFIEQTVVLLLPDRRAERPTQGGTADPRLLEAIGAGGRGDASGGR